MIKAGIIGCGNIAWKWDSIKSDNFNTHAKAYYCNPKVSLKACCDIDFKRAEGLAKNYPGAVPYADYKAMLSREGLDMVSISASTPAHFEILHHILEKTDIKYIIAEKPLTPDVNGTKKIRAMAKKKKAFILVNYVRRWDATLNQVRRFTSTGRLGSFQSGRALYYGGIKRNATHIIDFLLFLGIRLKFKGFLSGIKSYENDIAASMLFEAGRTKPVYFNWIDEDKFPCLEIDLFYENGRVRIGDCGDAEIFLAGDSVTYPGFRELILYKRLPSTICFAMKNMIDYFVSQYCKREVSFEPLDDELNLIRFISHIEDLGKRGCH